MLSLGLGTPVFPISNRVLGYGKHVSNFALQQPQLKPPVQQMLAERLRIDNFLLSERVF